VLGFPDSRTTLWRIATFFLNIVTILVVSLVVYIALRYRREAIQNYTATARRVAATARGNAPTARSKA
jgi:hypothetical protein